MIPKKIHYCWFGRNPLPKAAKKCIDSWRKHFPDYEIIEWNEDNYDVNKIKYTEDAYKAKNYAYVSDYARFDILYNEGGLYFDTDVEVIRSFEDILIKGNFMGCEIDGKLQPSEKKFSLVGKTYDDFTIRVNPGQGMGFEAGNWFCKLFLDFYQDKQYYKDDGTVDSFAVVRSTTMILASHGLVDCGGIQSIDGVYIYPKDYFNPFDYAIGVLDKTEHTHSIHWYSMSWLSFEKRVLIGLKRVIRRTRRTGR